MLLHGAILKKLWRHWQLDISKMKSVFHLSSCVARPIGKITFSFVVDVLVFSYYGFWQCRLFSVACTGLDKLSSYAIKSIALERDIRVGQAVLMFKIWNQTS